MDSGEVVLQARNLVKFYQNQQILKDINLEIRRGECIALLGPNGAGKTTVCEILEGLRQEDGGEILIFGMNYREHREKILTKIGVQLQETNLYKKYTVQETLELFASFYQGTFSITEIMRSLDLEDKKAKRLEHLSGGEKQRVYLASALIHKPDLIFLDEPTTGLDPQSRRKMWDVILNLKIKEKKSILLTTHYMEEAEKLADSVAILEKGKIIAFGTPKELIQRHGTQEVRQSNLEDVFMSLTGRRMEIVQ